MSNKKYNQTGAFPYYLNINNTATEKGEENDLTVPINNFMTFSSQNILIQQEQKIIDPELVNEIIVQ